MGGLSMLAGYWAWLLLPVSMPFVVRAVLSVAAGSTTFSVQMVLLAIIAEVWIEKGKS
jgi:hypothetical protein